MNKVFQLLLALIPTWSLSHQPCAANMMKDLTNLKHDIFVVCSVKAFWLADKNFSAILDALNERSIFYAGNFLYSIVN